MRLKKTLIPVAAVAAALTPAAAEAHVTLQPEQAPAGEFTRMDVRVPNEEDDAGTTKVAVQMPPGFVFASYEAIPGWRVKVAKRKLDRPIEEEGERITEEVARITWTGDGKRGIIEPGQFQDFGLSVGLPEGAGKSLTFKALQTYEGGKVVRWIGPPDSEEPAPQVKLTAAEGEGGPGANEPQAGTADQAPPTERVSAPTGGGEGGGAPMGLAVGALVVGALGLIVGTGAVLMARRGRTA